MTPVLKLVFFTALFVLCGMLGPQIVRAQDTLFVGPEPAQSSTEISLRYYAINWTADQWASLRGATLELGFLIDNVGEPFLRAVRGTDDQAIIDSLTIATSQLTYFKPAERAGVPTESAYYLSVPFPDLTHGQARSASSTVFFPLALVDRNLLESDGYELAPISGFLDLGGFAGFPVGAISEYLKPGGGMDLYFGLHWKGRWGVGGMIGLDFYDKKQLFPIDPFPTRDLDVGGGTYIGPLVEYTLRKTKDSDLAVRGEVAIATAIAATKLDPPDDEGFVRYQGLHLGVHLNYNMKFGRYGTSHSASDREVTGIYHGLNVNGGMRMRRFSYNEINGLYLFVGVGYRLGMNNLRKVE